MNTHPCLTRSLIISLIPILGFCGMAMPFSVNAQNIVLQKPVVRYGDNPYQFQINTTWNAVPGATSYEGQIKFEYWPSWTPVGLGSSTGLGTGIRTTEALLVKVRAVNAQGVSEWSDEFWGYLPLVGGIKPVFVSQSVPTDVKVNQVFLFSQVWLNSGEYHWAQNVLNGVADGAYSFNGTDVSNYQYTNINTSKTWSGNINAPSSPGDYTFSRVMKLRGQVHGSASPATTIRVWGEPKCSSFNLDKSVIYDPTGSVKLNFNANNQAKSTSVTVTNVATGVAKNFTPSAIAGDAYQLSIPVAGLGYGVNKVDIKASNPAYGDAVCQTQFEYRQLSKPSVTLEGIVGNGGSNNFVTGQWADAPTIKVTAQRSFDQALIAELFDATDRKVSSTTLSEGVQSSVLASPRWNGDAWSSANYSVRLRYADPGQALQGMEQTIPINLILSPSNNKLNLSISQTQPFQVTSAMSRADNSPYSASQQGNWETKLALNGGADLDAYAAIGGTGTRLHFPDYDSVYGQTLQGSARAIPPQPITLVEPIVITATAKVPLLPVKNIQASDGTFEDLVRVSWDAPLSSNSSFTYDVYRGGTLLQAGVRKTTFDDVPPKRGDVYEYSVIAKLVQEKSPEAKDTGFMPACRAARLVGATLNADMTAVNGLLEKLACLTDVETSASFDTMSEQPVSSQGTNVFRSFSVPIPPSLAEGPHVLHLRLKSPNVQLFADRTYDVNFVLNRASIGVRSLTILYDGIPATEGQQATSIGRFGLRMDGGSGLGLAEEVKP